MHVEKLCPPDKSVLCVPSDMPTINALAAAYTNHVSSVGIVDITAHGALCGMLSVSDVRGLQANQLDLLALPVLQFLEESPVCLRQQRHQVVCVWVGFAWWLVILCAPVCVHYYMLLSYVQQ